MYGGKNGTVADLYPRVSTSHVSTNSTIAPYLFMQLVATAHTVITDRVMQ
jgi:hypothetical protein